MNANEVLGIAIDIDAGNIKYYQNNVLRFDCTIPAGISYYPMANHCNGDTDSYRCKTLATLARPHSHIPRLRDMFR